MLGCMRRTRMQMKCTWWHDMQSWHASNDKATTANNWTTPGTSVSGRYNWNVFRSLKLSVSNTEKLVSQQKLVLFHFYSNNLFHSFQKTHCTHLRNIDFTHFTSFRKHITVICRKRITLISLVSKISISQIWSNAFHWFGKLISLISITDFNHFENYSLKWVKLIFDMTEIEKLN